MNTIIKTIGIMLLAVSVGLIAGRIEWGSILPIDVIVDPVEPIDEVEKSPFSDDGFNVLIVEEKGERHKLPEDQRKALASVRLRAWLQDNNIDWKIEDQEDPQEFGDQKWRDAMSLPRSSIPWIYAGNGKKGFSKALPTTNTYNELIADLEKLK